MQIVAIIYGALYSGLSSLSVSSVPHALNTKRFVVLIFLLNSRIHSPNKEKVTSNVQETSLGTYPYAYNFPMHTN